MKSVTIGIAAYNEESLIGRSVRSALSSVPAPMEVIVVASGCTDGTVDVVKEIMKREPKVRLIEERRRLGKGSAINQILKNARGDYLVMTDADLTFPPRSISELLAKFDSRTGAVSGRPQYFAKSALFGWWARFASECANRTRLKRGPDFHAISGYLYVLRRGIIKSIPISAKSEDAYVGEAVRQKGYFIRYAPKAIVNVGYAENYLDYLTQKVRTHYGHLEVFRKAGARNPLESARMAGGMRSEFREYFRVASEQIRNPAEFLYFISYLCTEFMVWCMAFLKYYLKGEETWKQIRSTKH